MAPRVGQAQEAGKAGEAGKPGRDGTRTHPWRVSASILARVSKIAVMGGLATTTAAPDSLRRGLRHLSRGLIAGGLVGLLVAGIGLGAMVWVNGRISDVRAEARTTVAQLSTTIDLAAVVLRGASTTAGSFSGTIDESAAAVVSAGGTIAEVRSDLDSVESQLRSINIFGATPLAPAADAIARIATEHGGPRHAVCPSSPLTSKPTGTPSPATPRRCTALAAGTAALAERLDPSTGQESLDDIQRVIAITLLMFAAWSVVPALGAIAFGLWLRRELGRLPRA